MASLRRIHMKGWQARSTYRSGRMKENSSIAQECDINYSRVRVGNGRPTAIRTLATKGLAGESKGLQWSYVHGPSDVPLLGTTIGAALQDKVEQHPDREAVVFSQDGIRKSFADLLEASDQLGAGLMELGLQRGDRVGIWGPNTWQWVITQFATARTGTILVNINPLYRPEELDYVLNKVGCKALIADEKYLDQDYYEILFSLIPELVNCKPGQLKSHRIPHLSSIIMMGEEHYRSTYKFSDVMEAGTHEKRSAILNLQTKLQFDDPINIQFTSGTTGFPKGSTLSHHNILNNSYFLGRIVGYHTRDSRICVPVPLYHCFGMGVGCLQLPSYGACCVFPSPGFEAGATLQAVQDERSVVPTLFQAAAACTHPALHTDMICGSDTFSGCGRLHTPSTAHRHGIDCSRCTSLYGVPTMFIDMLNHPEFDQFDLTSLYTGIMGGSPCPMEVMKQVIEKMHMPQVVVCYGTTETSPVTYNGYMDDPVEKKVSTVGHVGAHNEAKVINESGEIVEVGVPGELCTRGYTTMLGYWEDDSKTREVIHKDRWYHTGDIAEMDSEGYCKIVGRIKDMVIRGGENVYPTEIENCLYKNPKVQDVQVVGVPDERLGEELCACIKIHNGESATVEEIRKFCKQKLARFKVPRYVMFVDEYPLTVTGKVQKFKLREAALVQLNLQHVKPHA